MGTSSLIISSVLGGALVAVLLLIVLLVLVRVVVDHRAQSLDGTEPLLRGVAGEGITASRPRDFPTDLAPLDAPVPAVSWARSDRGASPAQLDAR